MDSYGMETLSTWRVNTNNTLVTDSTVIECGLKINFRFDTVFPPHLGSGHQVFRCRTATLFWIYGQ